MLLSFDDVLLQPCWSEIDSRKDVNPGCDFLGVKLNVPIISSNMDSVTDAKMANAMREAGAIGCLHRFWSVEDNVKAFTAAPSAMVSVGMGDYELERALALTGAGATHFVLDVAHGATKAVKEQAKKLLTIIGNGRLIVGNFATKETILKFDEGFNGAIAAYKVGIGGGSACTTRVVTGCGLPTLSSLFDCLMGNKPIICDGGIRNPGDLVKALAAGAAAVMMGGQLAGADESPADQYSKYDNRYLLRSDPYVEKYHRNSPQYKKYRGSASLESYYVQGKISNWRSPEGESFYVPCSGPVAKTIQYYEGGLRSGMSYCGAKTLDELRDNAIFQKVSSGAAAESKAHGSSNRN